MNNKNGDKKFELVEIHPDLLNSIDRQSLDEADWNLLVAMGESASEIKTYTQWILGKLGDAVSQKYGDLVKYANEIGVNYDSLRQYVYTYRKFISEDSTFHPHKYFGAASWSILALAATKSINPGALVNELQDKGIYTLKHAYRAINAGETEYGIPKKPVIDFEYDPQTKKYKFIMDVKDIPLIHWEPLIPHIFKDKNEQDEFRELLMRINEDDKRK